MAHDDRWDYPDPQRPRRYGNDDDYERDFWQDRESRGRRHAAENPGRRYESAPVLGLDLGGAPRSRGDWRRFDEPDEQRGRGYARDTDWSDPGRERGWWDRTKDEVRSWMGDADAEHRREADHRGRGPRGYTRSDERIREDVNDWLMEDRYVDASDIEVAVANGEVTLSGSVDRRETKRRAENIASGVLGVKDVHNRLRVTPTTGYGVRVGETAGAISGASPAGPETSSGNPVGEPRH
jgi:hypothetical protein